MDSRTWQTLDADLVTAYPRALIEAGPRIAAGDELRCGEEDRLKAHYGQHAPDANAAVLDPC